jgi:hypothetical protein
MNNNLWCFLDEVGLSVLRKRAEGARLRPFYQTFFSELERRYTIVFFWWWNMGTNLWCFFDEVGLSICARCLTLLSNFVFWVGDKRHHSFILGRETWKRIYNSFRQSRSLHLRKVFDLFIKLFSPSWREIHHSFILGRETWKRIYDAFSKRSFSPFAQDVWPFYQTFFSELERRDIIVSFWWWNMKTNLSCFFEEVVLSICAKCLTFYQTFFSESDRRDIIDYSCVFSLMRNE